MDVLYKKVEAINELIDAMRLRVEVFVIEQKRKPGWEPDEFDKDATHFVGIVNGQIVATARTRESVKGEIRIERMAIKIEYRRQGVGRGLLSYLVVQALKSKPKRIWLKAQIQAKTFYEKCGFRTVSEPYDLYGTVHIDLEYSNK